MFYLFSLLSLSLFVGSFFIPISKDDITGHGQSVSLEENSMSRSFSYSTQSYGFPFKSLELTRATESQMDSFKIKWPGIILNLIICISVGLLIYGVVRLTMGRVA
ncbi:MAG: hypothetical protein ACK5V3_17290 [Bdellovibrionales bacterium]